MCTEMAARAREGSLVCLPLGFLCVKSGGGTQALGPVTVRILGWTSISSTFGGWVHSWVLLRQPWRGGACMGHVEDVDPCPFLWLFNLNLSLLAPGPFTLI